MNDSNPVSVLLVVDNPANLFPFEVILGDLGVNLVRAAAANEALERLLDADFAAVILDVQMPGISGFEVAKLIRSRERSNATPIIFLIADEGANFPLREAYQLGAIDHLVKPLFAEVLRSKVGFLIAHHRQTHGLRAAEQRATATATAFQESEERFRLLTEALPQMVWTAQPDGTVEYFNRKWYEYTGNTRGTEGDAAWYPAFDTETGDRVYEAWYRAVRTGEPYELEYALRRAADGMHRWHLARALPLRDASGRIVRWFGAITDIHDQKEAQTRVTQLQQSEQAGRQKDEFLAMLAHELRNPLAPIRNGLSILRHGHTGEDREKVVGMMDRQIGQMVRLVDDLLDVSRVTTGKVTLRRELVTLQVAVDAAVETSRPLIDQSGHELRVRMPAEPLFVDADPTRLAQVVTNLLNNAAKFTPTGGSIELTAGVEGDEVVFAVSDNGIGIAAEMLPKVFDLFTQVGRSLDRSQGGLGIGLSLVRKLVELHGGSVTADSAGLGMGTTFSIRLPLPGRPTAETIPAARNGDRPAAAVRRILVVDDNVDAAESLALLLAIGGHESHMAHDGPSAIETARRLRPDVAFLDIGMPGMNGYEVAKTFRSDSALSRTMLVALTGWGTSGDRERAAEAGFDYHLTKPADAAHVDAVLTEATEKLR